MKEKGITLRGALTRLDFLFANTISWQKSQYNARRSI